MRAEEAAVPSLWWFEVRNILILIVNERRRRVAFSRRKRGPPAGPRSPESGTASFLPNLSPLSLYDAVYPELAQREGLPLATLNAGLRRAAAGEEVALFPTAMPSIRGPCGSSGWDKRAGRERAVESQALTTGTIRRLSMPIAIPVRTSAPL
jgi:hypothetical protein